jgi:curved DNA-binding protein CbpA
MTLFQTHYDNLKVSKNAPPEVITAAYKALSRQFHPDLNPNDGNAQRIMRIVNASYEVLSDPVKRRQHDNWIAAKQPGLVPPQNEATSTPKASPKVSAQHLSRANTKSARKFWAAVIGVAIFAGIALWAENQPPAPSGLPNYVAEPSKELAEAKDNRPSYVRPEKAPNGNLWPITASYVKGYPIARADGLSKLTIDNSSNSTDVFVKLVALDVDQTLPIRHAYIPANSLFTMNKIRAGQYDIRHMDLSDGSLSRSESFQLEEIQDLTGVRFSVTTMTLFKVANGNMQSYQLTPEEF